MLKSIALVLALAVSGLAVTAVSANAGPVNFTSHMQGEGQANTSCVTSIASYCS